jgi:hypothetical protein
MAVFKLRDIGEAAPITLISKQGENLRWAFELSDLCFRLARRPGLRGIRRYRSIEEASKEQR